MLPACYFASFQVASVPVRPFGSTTALPGLRRWQPLHCLRPVALPPLGSACRAHRLHSPPGLFHPSGSKRSTAFAACRSTWRIRPISSRSPPPVLMKVWAADHRSRSATFPPACCSSNLLEPFSLCSRSDFPSTFFGARSAFFLRIYPPLFQIFAVVTPRTSCG